MKTGDSIGGIMHHKLIIFSILSGICQNIPYFGGTGDEFYKPLVEAPLLNTMVCFVPVNFTHNLHEHRYHHGTAQIQVEQTFKCR